jgi:hypothetical protein
LAKEGFSLSDERGALPAIFDAAGTAKAPYSHLSMSGSVLAAWTYARPEDADAVVVNTCGFVEAAKKWVGRREFAKVTSKCNLLGRRQVLVAEKDNAIANKGFANSCNVLA